MPSGESDTDQSDTGAAMAAEQAIAIVAMMLGCLTGSQADTPAGSLTAAQLMLDGVSPESARVRSGTSRRPRRDALRLERH